jgi:phospholipid/cholesterol/gamma-HCH transport system substrate-binding protein
LLTALQSDTRADLQVLLHEYATKGLGNGGAQAYNQSLNFAPGAYLQSSIANQATLGREPGDLHNLERGQQRLFHELDTNPVALKDLIVQLNIFAGALAREDAPLSAAIPALRDTLRVGTPALVALNNSFPSLRAFARDALPGTKSSVPALDASIPTVTQLRLLIRPQELRGLVADLRPTIPALARLQHNSVPLFNENRALSACSANVLAPFAKTPIIDPDFPANSGAPFYQVSARGLVGLAGESRINDANSPLQHVQFGSGPTTVIYTHNGQSFFAAAPAPPEGVRPIKQTNRPPERPDIPCETQLPPSLTAAGGTPDQSVTAPGNGLLPPLPIPFNQKIAAMGNVQLNEIMDYELRTKRGMPTADPVSNPNYTKQMKQLGLDVLPSGKVVAAKKGSGK